MAQRGQSTDILVIGGGTAGTAAAVEASRQGARVILAEPGPWLGGMVSAAGVSATDGNHQLPSGLWNEFRERIYAVYGGADKVATGWVSNTQFEPHVADSILKEMCKAEPNLRVLHGFQFKSVRRKGNRLTAVEFLSNGTPVTIISQVVIDATEMGDVLAAAGAPFDLGMEAGAITGERVGVKESNRIVQDLTYVAILKDYGMQADCTIVKPANYTPTEFDGACSDYYINKDIKKPTSNARQMLDYGKLPNNKYLINWPIKGNDSYLEVVDMTADQRDLALKKARQKTLRFVYFIQTQLGFQHLGLADDEFPTADRLALMPYYREGRRVRGLVRLTINHISDPFCNGQPLYRTGISVGDYPIDHHHKENLSAPQHLDFYPVPSFNVPLGSLIPQGLDNLIIAEKGISVSNVVNGTTRLQPCVMLTGQAAGLLAALSVKHRKAPSLIPVRDVQSRLLAHKAFIMPYLDVLPTSPYFDAVQRIGATGILRGTGIPYQWANQTWFYPDSLVDASEFNIGWKEYSSIPVDTTSNFLTIKTAIDVIHSYLRSTGIKHRKYIDDASTWSQAGLTDFRVDRFIRRQEMAVLLDKTIEPFSKRVTITGNVAK